MPRPVLYFAVTNHGFGHAVRAASVAAAIQRLNPEILLILVTTAPRWLLESYIPGDFIQRPRGFDVGVVQTDSLTMDKAATLEKLQAIQAQQKAIIASEVNFLRQNRVGLVLADIPPLAAPIARAAGVPVWMMSNFGWDFIYKPWGPDFAPIVSWIEACFGQCDRLFRLPFHEPMVAFPQITDVGLTGGIPAHDLAELRQHFGLSAPTERTVLLTFGGLGLSRIPYEALAQFPDWQFITFDAQAPKLPNLCRVQDHRYRPVDFMPLCGRVVSKPGYSTFAEAVRVGVPIASLPREDFAEAPLLLEGIRDRAYHQILSPTAFEAGDWSFLHEEPQSPRFPEAIAPDGDQAIAQAVVDFFARAEF